MTLTSSTAYAVTIEGRFDCLAPTSVESVSKGLYAWDRQASSQLRVLTKRLINRTVATLEFQNESKHFSIKMREPETSSVYAEINRHHLTLVPQLADKLTPEALPGLLLEHSVYADYISLVPDYARLIALETANYDGSRLLGWDQIPPAVPASFTAVIGRPFLAFDLPAAFLLVADDFTDVVVCTEGPPHRPTVEAALRAFFASEDVVKLRKCSGRL